jgi:DNA replication protein DnaC
MSAATSELDRSRALLERMGFECAPRVLAELVERAVREKLSLAQFLELVVGTERDFREERRVRTALKLSGLPVGKTIDGYDFGFARGVDRQKVELLATCEFAKRRENVLLLGDPGLGKSHLGAAIGVKCVENGFSVAYLTADELMEMLRRDEEGNRRRQLRRKYMTAAVLIVDELGFQELDRRDASALFRVVAHRYERSSTIITSNKGVGDWPKMLAGDEVIATAILDRLLHHCHVVRFEGPSWRLKELEEAAIASSKSRRSSSR